MTMFHRNAKPIPSVKTSFDRAERKARVRWCMKHRLWHYPVAVPPFDGVVLIGGFQECVEIDFVYVDPKTERIEDDDARNTA